MSESPLTPFGSALAGAIGAVCSNALVYPLDTVKTRLQALPPFAIESTSSTLKDVEKGGDGEGLLGRLKRWKMLVMLIRILKTEGVGGAFKGFGANMINTFSMQFAYFFFHSLLRTATIKRLSTRPTPQKGLSTRTELLLGAAAGGLAQIFTIPVAVIATRQQLYIPPTSSSSSPTGNGKTNHSPSLLETAKEIIEEDGLTGLWTGLKPGLVLTVNPAITYGVFERLKSWLLVGGRVNGKLSVGEAFLLGVCSKTLATVVTYPYIFAKVRLQAKPSLPPAGETLQPQAPTYAEIATLPPSPNNSAALPDHSINTPPPPPPGQADEGVKSRRAKKVKGGALELLAGVYKERGLGGWYQGMSAQIVKAVLCQGILFVTKDQFEVYARLLIKAFTKVKVNTLKA